VVDLLGVHGIGQQQLGPNQMLPGWSRALSDAVQFARGRQWPKPSMDLAFYGDLFLESTESKGLPTTISSDEELQALDADSLSFLERVEDEVVAADEPLDDRDPSKAFRAVPGPLSRLGAWLEDRFGIAGKLLFFADLVQVRLFQREPDLASRVLDRVKEGLEGRPRVLIGHSLGSIVGGPESGTAPRRPLYLQVGPDRRDVLSRAYGGIRLSCAASCSMIASR